MYGTELKSVDCPYCNEQFEIIVDTSVVDQEYIEDCEVCCRPINFRVSIDIAAGTVSVVALHENEC